MPERDAPDDMTLASRSRSILVGVDGMVEAGPDAALEQAAASDAVRVLLGVSRLAEPPTPPPGSFSSGRPNRWLAYRRTVVDAGSPRALGPGPSPRFGNVEDRPWIHT